MSGFFRSSQNVLIALLARRISPSVPESVKDAVDVIDAEWDKEREAKKRSARKVSYAAAIPEPIKPIRAKAKKGPMKGPRGGLRKG